MNLKELEASALEARKAEIASECEKDDANLDALLEEVRAINEELESRKAEEAKKVEIRELVAEENVGEQIATTEFVTEERKEESTMEIRNSKEYIDAFAKYVRTEDDRECRSLLTENVNGNVPVPDFVYGIIADELKESPILSRVRHMNAAGNLKVGFEASAPAAGKHTEGGNDMAEEELVLGIVTLVPTTFKKWVSISDEALDMANGEAYLRYVYAEVARGIIKAEEDEVVAKILAAPQTATATAAAVAKTGSAAGEIADFVNARALLSSAARDLCIICTPAQYAQYKGLQMAANYGVDPFDGCPVLLNDTVTAPIIGDLKGIMFNEVSDIQVKFDDKTLMTKDLVRILGRQMAAIEVVGNLYFAKVSA